MCGKIKRRWLAIWSGIKLDLRSVNRRSNLIWLAIEKLALTAADAQLVRLTGLQLSWPWPLTATMATTVAYNFGLTDDVQVRRWWTGATGFLWRADVVYSTCTHWSSTADGPRPLLCVFYTDSLTQSMAHSGMNVREWDCEICASMGVKVQAAHQRLNEL